MEDHIDKIVYIVIAIVITIVSAISKANKKKNISKLGKPASSSQPTANKTTPPDLPGTKHQQTPPPQAKINNDIDALFASLQKPKVEQKVTQVKKEEPKVVVEESMKTDKHKKKVRAETSDNFIETELEIDEVEDSYLDDFDAQKAVIYSEIMNRKYT